jgi:hypothetical protein
MNIPRTTALILTVAFGLVAGVITGRTASSKPLYSPGTAANTLAERGERSDRGRLP